MREGDFIEMIVAAGLVVTDDFSGYQIRREYNGPALVNLARKYVERATDDDIAQILAINVPGLEQYQAIGSSNKGCLHALISAYWGLIKFLFHKRE